MQQGKVTWTFKTGTQNCFTTNSFEIASQNLQNNIQQSTHTTIKLTKVKSKSFIHDEQNCFTKCPKTISIYHSKIIQQSNEQCVERSSRKLTLTFRKQSNVKIDVLQHEEEVADDDSPSSMTVL
jgi:acetyl-CoA carboxylase beta subunit